MVALEKNKQETTKPREKKIEDKGKKTNNESVIKWFSSDKVFKFLHNFNNAKLKAKFILGKCDRNL